MAPHDFSASKFPGDTFLLLVGTAERRKLIAHRVIFIGEVQKLEWYFSLRGYDDTDFYMKVVHDLRVEIVKGTPLPEGIVQCTNGTSNTFSAVRIFNVPFVHNVMLNRRCHTSHELLRLVVSVGFFPSTQALNALYTELRIQKRRVQVQVDGAITTRQFLTYPGAKPTDPPPTHTILKFGMTKADARKLGSYTTPEEDRKRFKAEARLAEKEAKEAPAQKTESKRQQKKADEETKQPAAKKESTPPASSAASPTPEEASPSSGVPGISFVSSITSRRRAREAEEEKAARTAGQPAATAPSRPAQSANAAKPQKKPENDKEQEQAKPLKKARKESPQRQDAASGDASKKAVVMPKCEATEDKVAPTAVASPHANYRPLTAPKSEPNYVPALAAFPPSLTDQVRFMESLRIVEAWRMRKRKL